MQRMKNKNVALAIALVFLTSLLLGCSGGTKSSAGEVGKHEIVRQAVLGGKWQMYQLRITLDAGTDFDVLLTLAKGDTVDGYFYPEKGSGAAFNITADSQFVYSSQSVGATTAGTVSDRYSFTASQAQGNTYVLNFNNTLPDTKVTMFLEIVYPVTGSIYIPLEAK